MLKILVPALAALLVSSQAALATPIISGKYIIHTHTICQALLTFHFNTNGQNDGVTMTGSDNAQEIISVNFNVNKGKASVNEFKDHGSPVMVTLTGSQNGNQGDLMSEKTQSSTIPYSNTDTTVTFGDETSNVFYGDIDKNGIAHTLIFQGIELDDNGNPCSTQGGATRQ